MDVRTRILEAAFRLLTESGVAEVTQPKVSRAAGVSQSHLTYYFPKRTDLLLAIARHAVAETLGRLRAAAPAAPEEVAALLQSRLADKRLVRLMLGLISASDEDPGIRDAVRDLVAGIRGMLRAALEANGAVVDERQLAALHATLVGSAVLNLARDTEASRREIPQVIALAFERFAAAPQPAPRRKSAARRRPR